jgi:hypothetical protein
MKTAIFAGFVSMMLAATALARVGEDVKQIETRYGQPGKDLGEHGDIHEFGFLSNGFLIVVSFVNGVSQREGFTNPDTTPLSDQNIKDILAISSEDGTTWQEGRSPSGDKMWARSDKKVIAIFPAMGKFLFVQDANFVQPK